MSRYQVTDSQIEQFQDDGFLFVESLFDAEEVDYLLTIGQTNEENTSNAHRDAGNRETRFWINSETGEDIYTAICYSRRMVDAVQALMNSDVYLWHYRVHLKAPREGGAFEWHQDYAYWYDKCLYPDLISCLIAADRADKHNGCMQVLRGSHKLGRIEHGQFGTQNGADPERMAWVEQHCERVYCETEPGTAVFFHANLLHRSDPNESDNPRWSLVCAYNTKHNPCRERPHHPGYRPLETWEDRRVREIGKIQCDDIERSALGPDRAQETS